MEGITHAYDALERADWLVQCLSRDVTWLMRRQECAFNANRYSSTGRVKSLELPVWNKAAQW